MYLHVTNTKSWYWQIAINISTQGEVIDIKNMFHIL